MKEIILCGVVHSDICGIERLKKVLEKEKPDCITLECSQENLQSSLNAIKELDKKKLALTYGTRKIEFTPFKQNDIVKMNKETITKFFSQIFFELRESKEYSEKNNIKIVCVEKDQYINEHYKLISRDIKKGTIYYFSAFSPDHFEFPPDAFKKISDVFYKDTEKIKINDELKNILVIRDEYSINEILKLDYKKILHIGGVRHFYGNYKNMFEVLKEKGINIRRMKLCEADDL